MDQKQEMINHLNDAYSLLTKALITLKEINSYEQFDYVISSRLADAFNSVEEQVKKIDKIIYQK